MVNVLIDATSSRCDLASDLGIRCQLALLSDEPHMAETSVYKNAPFLKPSITDEERNVTCVATHTCWLVIYPRLSRTNCVLWRKRWDLRAQRRWKHRAFR